GEDARALTVLLVALPGNHEGAVLCGAQRDAELALDGLRRDLEFRALPGAVGRETLREHTVRVAVLAAALPRDDEALGVACHGRELLLIDGVAVDLEFPA